MIVPLITYNSTVNLHHSQTKIEKYRSLQRRADAITGKDSINIESFLYRDACILVRKILDNDVCENYNEYFKINTHNKRTRNQNNLIKLPRIKLEIARKSFYYLGAKLYNDLPISIRKEEDFRKFKALIKRHFK